MLVGLVKLDLSLAQIQALWGALGLRFRTIELCPEQAETSGSFDFWNVKIAVLPEQFVLHWLMVAGQIPQASVLRPGADHVPARRETERARI
jgi:hypothetical protein